MNCTLVTTESTLAFSLLVVMASVSSEEYQSVIRFLVLKKIEPKKIIKDLQSVYGDNSSSGTTIYYNHLLQPFIYWET